MTHHVEAIFDNGVFRPTGPVSLPDQSRVEIIVLPPVEPMTELATEPAPKAVETEEEIAIRQWKAARELDELLALFPDNSPDDGFSGADHDRILYGKPT
ncbi:MAG TPA: antitoxin family protein [Lacipirellulaceae bacterium]|nr:antitoxin family protein [Lacipirellulaceae bacterium]